MIFGVGPNILEFLPTINLVRILDIVADLGAALAKLAAPAGA
ncbi:MAG: hypothetical protein ACHRXM_29595 [Isosphaerales bacterium]